MKTAFLPFCASALTIVLFGSAAIAQDAAYGAKIYSDHCAVCHGETGGGDGVVGLLLAQRPAALTLLSKGNNGEFPTDRVISAIDGRGKIPGHGNSRMPIWGDYFMVEALEGPAIDPADAAMIAQGRMLSVVAFLEQIQAN